MSRADLTIVPSEDQGVNPSGSDGGGGNGRRGDLSVRVARLETELKHLATKAWILVIAFGIILSVGSGVWHLSGRLATIETKLISIETSFESYKKSHNREHDSENSQ